MFMRSFYTHRSQKRKKLLDLTGLFLRFWDLRVKLHVNTLVKLAPNGRALKRKTEPSFSPKKFRNCFQNRFKVDSFCLAIYRLKNGQKSRKASFKPISQIKHADQVVLELEGPTINVSDGPLS